MSEENNDAMNGTYSIPNFSIALASTTILSDTINNASPPTPEGSPRENFSASMNMSTIRSLDKLFSQNESTAHNVRVCLRVRPLLPREIAKDTEEGITTPTPCIVANNHAVTILDPKTFLPKEAFEFDEVFWGVPPAQIAIECPAPVVGQEEVYQSVGVPAVQAAMRGLNACLFAYGQTGSGKTHTMLGSPQDPGIAPRLVRYLFQEMKNQSEVTDPTLRMESTVELSFLEIYNEKVKDLLNIAHQHGGASSPRVPMTKTSPRDPKKGGGGGGGSSNTVTEYKECRVRYHPDMGTFVEGLTRQQIDTAEGCLEFIENGMQYRAVAATNMNDHSSRSHAIFQLCIRSKNVLAGTQRISILNIVDLAGSERIKMSGASGTVLTEAKNINLSLTTLRRVIDVLIHNASCPKTKQRKQVPPYRESVLTWVLSDTLGGNSMTTMLAAVSPHASNFEDTLSTLRYALKAKSIVCSVRVNETKSAAVAEALKQELEKLRQQFEDTKSTMSQEVSEQMQVELQQRETELERKNQELDTLKEMQTKLQDVLKESEEKLKAAESEREKVTQEAQIIVEELKEKSAAAEEKTKELGGQLEQVQTEYKEVMRRRISLHHKNTALSVVQKQLETEIKEERTRNVAFKLYWMFTHKKSREAYEKLAKKLKAVEQKLESVEITLKDCTEAHEATTKKKEQKIVEQETTILDLQAAVDTLTELLQKSQQDHSEVHAKYRQLLKDKSQEKEIFDRELRLSQLRCNELEVRLLEYENGAKLSQEHLERKQSDVLHYSSTLEEVREDNKRLQKEKEDLLEERSKLMEDLDASRKETCAALEDASLKAVQLSELQVRGTTLEVELSSLKRSHEDLKSFVTKKAFPTFHRASSPNNSARTGGGGNLYTNRSRSHRSPSNEQPPGGDPNHDPDVDQQMLLMSIGGSTVEQLGGGGTHK
eukprot:PhF_6_TR10548/c2_g1_i2/m.16720/K17914/KIF13; kinesin family member 13